MPSYLEAVAIDWAWRSLSPTEQSIARKFEARLRADPHSHTATTFQEFLAEASRALPGRALRGKAEDDGTVVWSAFHGVVRPGTGYDPSGECTESLTAEDFRAAGIDRVHSPVFWSETQLALLSRWALEDDVTLSRFVTQAWREAAQREWIDPPADKTKRLQRIFLSIDVWVQVTQKAASLDRSVSWVLQRVVATVGAGR